MYGLLVLVLNLVTDITIHILIYCDKKKVCERENLENLWRRGHRRNDRRVFGGK